MGDRGAAAGVALAMDIAEEELLAEPEQLELAGLLGLSAERAANGTREHKGLGRPAGSRNKRTLATAEYLLKRYRNPVEGLLQMGMMGVEELAAALGCSRLEAWQERRICLAAAAPYVVQRQPIAVNVSERKQVHITFQTLDAGPAPIEGDVLALEVENKHGEERKEHGSDEHG